jgi:hypothetical protein
MTNERYQDLPPTIGVSTRTGTVQRARLLRLL